ncbi:Alpha/beta hydrolase family-domain-containing protein [Roridomyces roridus]|uniref:Alpha/beta hydrolase family-domain-containing protein n=1 Tax=Roridomyces roridus TaxID=1738132 RepID=A0AAD7F9X9_9AGAR|nr:Alpha/beta hydrolase family-domain-containing protein [Roridomyces roridus]
MPVHIEALLPTDPLDALAGLQSNASGLRRLDDTYNMIYLWCFLPPGGDVVQLLVHGFTYTNQYWSPPAEEFKNYSYAAFSCDRGIPSLAVDWLGVGLSSRPPNASDVQYPSVSAVMSQIARNLKSGPIISGIGPFKKVIGVGHSAGSGLLNFGAIIEGSHSPFDGLVLTSALIVEPGSLGPSSTSYSPARDVDPVRWATLDPAYVSNANRTAFYPRDKTAFSPRMIVFDNFTKDVGTVSMFAQIPTTSLPNQYAGPVVKIVGSEDQLFCNGDTCNNVTALTEAEQVLWPDARSFDVVVAEGSGHDLNLDFHAMALFNTFVAFVEKFAGL